MAELKLIPFFYGSFYVIEKTPKELGEEAGKRLAKKLTKLIWNKRS